MVTVFAQSNVLINIVTKYFEDIINRSLIQQPRIRQITNINQQFLLLLVPRIPENFKTNQNLPITAAYSWPIFKHKQQTKNKPNKQNKCFCFVLCFFLLDLFFCWGAPAIGPGAMCSECCSENQPGRPSLWAVRDQGWFLPVARCCVA